jgi:phospholipid/cholesterol/gamma-HCH transport system substrate-binding protein
LAQNNTFEALLGAAVLCVAAFFLFYMSQFRDVAASGGAYELSARFQNIGGVSIGTEVKLAGVKVGTVTELALESETYQAEAKFQIEKAVLIPDDSAVRIDTEGLLGGSYVEILPGGSEFMYEAGDEIIDTQGSVSLLNLLMKFASGGGDN